MPNIRVFILLAMLIPACGRKNDPKPQAENSQNAPSGDPSHLGLVKNDQSQTGGRGRRSLDATQIAGRWTFRQGENEGVFHFSMWSNPVPNVENRVFVGTVRSNRKEIFGESVLPAAVFDTLNRVTFTTMAYAGTPNAYVVQWQGTVTEEDGALVIKDGTITRPIMDDVPNGGKPNPFVVVRKMKTEPFTARKAGGGSSPVGTPKRVLVFSLYYNNPDKDPDHSFMKASETEMDVAKATRVTQYGASNVESVTFHFKTKEDFLNAWRRVALKAQDEKLLVVEGHVFSHASIDTREDGLEFDKASATLTRQDVSGLQKLPWAESSDVKLVLHGSNTGVKGRRGWCPAEEFAQVQGAQTLGQDGFAFFSSQFNGYKSITPKDKMVYLWAYRRGSNSRLGDGVQLRPVVFLP